MDDNGTSKSLNAKQLRAIPFLLASPPLPSRRDAREPRSVRPRSTPGLRKRLSGKSYISRG